MQRQGSGQGLVREGLVRLKELGAQGCILVGDPTFYKRFGFESMPGLSMEGVPHENVLALSFTERRAKRNIIHQHAFSVKE